MAPMCTFDSSLRDFRRCEAKDVNLNSRMQVAQSGATLTFGM